jgi:hypothetical protein
MTLGSFAQTQICMVSKEPIDDCDKSVFCDNSVTNFLEDASNRALISSKVSSEKKNVFYEAV